MSDLTGVEVAVFEGRRATEIAALVRAGGGEVVAAPSVEIALLDAGPDLVEMAAALREGRLDGVLFLTGVGVHALVDLVSPIMARDELLRTLASVPLGARGPKTVAALAELGLTDVVQSHPPHDWRALLQAFDRAHPVGGRHIALQESGSVHALMRSALDDAGAHVLPVAVYRWVLPHDVSPLNAAIDALVSRRVRVALFTSEQQIGHAMAVASERDMDEPLRAALRDAVVGAIGPVTAERLRAFGIEPALVSFRGTMGDLVAIVAARAKQLLQERP